MSGRNAGNTFNVAHMHDFHRRYMSLMASLHALSVELEAKKFPCAEEKLWEKRSTAVAVAVRTLIDGQHLAKRKKNAENIFDV